MKKIAKYKQLITYLNSYSTETVNYWESRKPASYLDSIFEVNTININLKKHREIHDFYYKIVKLSELDMKLIKNLSTVINVRINL